MSETWEKSQLSEFFDVSSGCFGCFIFFSGERVSTGICKLVKLLVLNLGFYHNKLLLFIT